MLDRLKYSLANFMRIKPEDHVPEAVARNFKHNAIINTLDISFFFMADSFWSINTIIPVFASSLTDSPFLIGLMPAIVNAGWFLPQMFLSGKVSRLPKVLPLAIHLSILERIPYLLFPLLAIMVPRIPNSAALFALVVLLIWRGISGGMIALPWQELMARVIPITHRARFFGFSRVIGQSFGIVGSAISALALALLDYPYNYALGFSIGVVVQWISFFTFMRNREPERPALPATEVSAAQINKMNRSIDFSLFGQILKRDANFRLYLVARSISFIGHMASAFIAVFAISNFSLSDEQAAVFTGLLFASGILGYVIWGSIGDRIGPKRIVVISFVVWVLGLLVAIFSRSIWFYYLAFVSFGIYSSGSNVGDSMLVMELGEEALRPTYLGMARTLTGSFLLLAPVVAGWLVESFSYQVMFTASAIFSIISILLMTRVKDRPRGRAAAMLEIQD